MSWARGTSIAMGRDKHHPRPPSCQADRYVVRGPWRVVTSSHVSTPLPHSPFPGLWTDERIRAAYSEGAGIYRIVPAGVAIPRGVEDLQQLVRWAAETGTALVARGGGSGMAGGRVGRGGRVGGGRCRLAPASSDLVRARFPRTRKNSGGYALDRFAESGDELDLLIGSEGTLAFITAVQWRLEPIPPDVAGAVLGFATLDALTGALPFLVALNPSAVGVLHRPPPRFGGAPRGGPPPGLARVGRGHAWNPLTVKTPMPSSSFK